MFQASNVEVTWVISDYVGNAVDNELSVTKGQQVEVLEMSSTTPEFCLVRVTTVSAGASSSTVGSGAQAGTSSKSIGSIGVGGQEGLVPISILKPPPTFKTSPRRTLDLESSGMYI